jgi:small subunit ribosomal protein S21
MVQVVVHQNNIEQALRALKKKMQREGIFRDMKMKRFYEPGSVKKVRKDQESRRRRLKMIRKRNETL